MMTESEARVWCYDNGITVLCIPFLVKGKMHSVPTCLGCIFMHGRFYFHIAPITLGQNCVECTFVTNVAYWGCQGFIGFCTFCIACWPFDSKTDIIIRHTYMETPWFLTGTDTGSLPGPGFDGDDSFIGPVGTFIGPIVLVVVVAGVVIGIISIVVSVSNFSSSGRGLETDKWEVDHSVWMNQLQKDFEDSWSEE